jgi:hypothetical protein
MQIRHFLKLILTMKKSIVLILLISLLSCSEKEKNSLLKTEKISLELGQAGISSDKGFPFFIGDSSIILYNEFLSSFSELNPLTKKNSLFRSFENDSRFGETPFSYFSLIKKNLLLLDSKNIWLVGDQELSKYPLEKMEVQGETGIEISNYSFEINSGFGKYIPSLGDEVFMILKEDGKKENQYIVKYDPAQPSILKNINKINSKNLQDQSLELKMGGMYLSNMVTPYISVVGDRVFISYPFQNSFDAVNLISGSTMQVQVESKVFKNQKNKQKLLSDELVKFQESVKAWNNDVAFGPILKVPSEDMLFRIVKGESEGLYPIKGDLYLQLFNYDLELMHEELISNAENNYLEEYFATSNGIYIKTMGENEDSLTYLKLTVHDSK